MARAPNISNRLFVLSSSDERNDMPYVYNKAKPKASSSKCERVYLEVNWIYKYPI